VLDLVGARDVPVRDPDPRLVLGGQPGKRRAVDDVAAARRLRDQLGPHDMALADQHPKDPFVLIAGVDRDGGRRRRGDDVQDALARPAHGARRVDEDRAAGDAALRREDLAVREQPIEATQDRPLVGRPPD
jgi:hypothetical protein